MAGREFYKMSGSGNDFVVVDARAEPPGDLARPDTVQAVCARGTGVGADGMVFLEPSRTAEVRMTYLNSDGSRAALCGNATLCVTSLAARLGIVGSRDFGIETDSGVVRARVRGRGPEIDLQAPSDLRREVALALEPGEKMIGFVEIGVPHLVVLVEDAGAADVLGRGAALRRHAALGPAGANVNFVSPGPAGQPWQLRTFERGVEGETLACGTGAVATAVMLESWGLSGSETTLRTRSGRDLQVRFRRDGDTVTPSLAGEGRVVFRGELAEI